MTTDPADGEAEVGAVPHLPSHYTRRDMHRDFKAVLGSEQGRRVLGHLFAWCGVWSPALRSEHMTASEATMFHEGKRSVAFDIVSWMRSATTEPEKEVTYGGRDRA